MMETGYFTCTVCVFLHMSRNRLGKMCVCVGEIDEVPNIEAYLNLRRYPEHDLYT